MAGFLFFWHGSQKILGFPPFELPPGAPPPPAFIIWTAGLIELVGGLLVMIGLFTAPAAFVSSGLMAAAYWMAHGLKAPLPIQNGGELSVLYCFVFLYIAARGDGPLSVGGGRST